MCRIVAGVGRACVAMTQSELMRAKTGLAAAFCCVCTMLAAQTTDDPVAVFTEHPRLFLRPQRPRPLKRGSAGERPPPPPPAPRPLPRGEGGAPAPPPRGGGVGAGGGGGGRPPVPPFQQAKAL